MFICWNLSISCIYARMCMCMCMVYKLFVCWALQRRKEFSEFLYYFWLCWCLLITEGIKQKSSHSHTHSYSNKWNTKCRAHKSDNINFFDDNSKTNNSQYVYISWHHNRLVNFLFLSSQFALIAMSNKCTESSKNWKPFECDSLPVFVWLSEMLMGKEDDVYIGFCVTLNILKRI